MKIMRMNDNWNKINTREELIELLKNYKGILTDSMISYLNSLIDLEFSVIRDYISDNDRMALSELEVFKRIAMYNIYNRALNIFKQNDSELIIYGNNDGIEGLNVYTPLEKRKCKLFDFNYSKGTLEFKEKIQNDYDTMRIGNISLFKTIESKEQREAELIRIMGELNSLYHGVSFSQHAFEDAKKIKIYEEKYNTLNSKKELTDEDKKEIEITKKFHKLLLEDYDLTNKDFEDKSNQDFSNFHKEKTELNKTLVKRMPNINIKNNIKYI